MSGIILPVFCVFDFILPAMKFSLVASFPIELILISFDAYQRSQITKIIGAAKTSETEFFAANNPQKDHFRSFWCFLRQVCGFTSVEKHIQYLCYTDFHRIRPNGSKCGFFEDFAIKKISERTVTSVELS